jgi:hypothetical protein
MNATTSSLRAALALLAVSIAASACVTVAAPDASGAGNDGAGNAGNTGAGNSGNTGAGAGGPAHGDNYCCIDGAFYDCPTTQAVTQCIGFDIDACMDACAFDDFDCQDACFDAWASSTPDTSACARDAARDGDCAGPGPGPDPDPEPQPGCLSELSACDYDDDCCSGNCTGGTCYGNLTGDYCDYDDDCSSGNCTGGVCYGGFFGDPCDYDDDCQSGFCTGGECQ